MAQYQEALAAFRERPPARKDEEGAWQSAWEKMDQAYQRALKEENARLEQELAQRAAAEERARAEGVARAQEKVKRRAFQETEKRLVRERRQANSSKVCI